MKKITLLLILANSITCFAQQKSTGDVTLSTNMSVNITLDNTTQKATIIFTGPSDRWFALQFGSFGFGEGMAAGEDLVYANATTLIDGNHTGYGSFPNTDSSNDWAVTSNTVASGVRTITAQRNFSTGDANDYTFNYANTSIDLVWARSSGGYALSNHGGANRGYQIGTSFTSLGIEDFSLNASSIYPNPSNGVFNVETKTGLDNINVYSQTGSLLKAIKINDKSNTTELDLKDLQKGFYLVELQNSSEKSWKKIIIE